MPVFKKRSSFFDSEEGVEVKRTLCQMVADSAYHTKASYSADKETYPDNLMPFVDKHMNYLNTHPNLSPRQYITNLRLMTRIKPTLGS